MEDEKLNRLIYSYQNGDELALNTICEEFLPWITRMSERVWYKVNNNAQMECRFLLQLKRALTKFDPEKGRARSLIANVIVKERSMFLKGKRGRLRETSSFEELRKFDNEGNETDFDVIDVLANVEDVALDTVSVNEKTALLAKGDSKKLAILKAWTQGFYNDSDLSRMLKHSFGGKEESHRKFIRRFRTECQTTLSQVV